MSVPLTFAPDQSRTLDKPVRRIDVAVGSVIVTETDNPVVVKTDETFSADDVASLTVYSPEGAKISVTYFDEEVVPPRKDTLEAELAAGEKAKALAEDQNNPFGVEAAENKIHRAQRSLDRHFPRPKPKRSRASSKKSKSKPKARKSAAAKSTRGDSGGTGGSFESRTVDELAKLAKERGVEVKGKGGKKAVKADFIKALRKG